MKTEDIPILLSGLSLIFSLVALSTSHSHHESPHEVIENVDTVEVVSEWDSLISALIHVESNGNDNAINPTSGASGCLQLMPIFVDEVNRVALTSYTYDDRFDREKSIEMFNEYQAHYNPERDIHEAIRRHNPTAGEWYYNRVINAMNQ